MAPDEARWADASVHVWTRGLALNARVAIGLVLVAGAEPLRLVYGN